MFMGPQFTVSGSSHCQDIQFLEISQNLFFHNVQITNNLYNSLTPWQSSHLSQQNMVLYLISNFHKVSNPRIFHFRASCFNSRHQALHASPVEHHGNCPHGPAQAPFSPRRARRGVSSELNTQYEHSTIHLKKVEWI